MSTLFNSLRVHITREANVVKEANQAKVAKTARARAKAAKEVKIVRTREKEAKEGDAEMEIPSPLFFDDTRDAFVRVVL